MLSDADPKEARPLRVLEGSRPPQPELNYIDQIVGDGAPLCDFRYFGGALPTLDVDVLHVHQLDGILGGRAATGSQRLAKARAITKELKRTGTALVQTVSRSHRAVPGLRNRLAHRMIDRATAAFVVLDDDIDTPDATRTTRIAHAHYRDRYLGYPRLEMVEGRLLCVARTQLERVAPLMLGLFAVMDTPGLSLRVVGATDASLSRELARAGARKPGAISARIEPLSDSMIIEEISAAEVVVVPRAETFREQSMLLLALSLDRPVIVPATATTSRLAAEVGAAWVHTVQGPLTGAALDDAMVALRGAPRDAAPALDGRGMAETAARYAEVFRTAASSSRRADRS